MKAPKIIYGSETNKSLFYATQLSKALSIQVISADDYDFSSFNDDFLIIIISTYNDGQPPKNAINFFKTIHKMAANGVKEEIENNNSANRKNVITIFKGEKNTNENSASDGDKGCDINKNLFDTSYRYSSITYAIYGLGNRSYGADFNRAAINLHNNFRAIGGVSVVVSMGDELVGFENSFFKFASKVAEYLRKLGFLKNKTIPLSNLANSIFNQSDLMGSGCKSAKDNDAKKMSFELEDIASNMITPLLRTNLVKQGYRLIGGHSAVKLCRWTKAMLKGRGGCYKHSFYGIDSHRCMEMTPNLACANKCVFCWRHHTNPVSLTWKWPIDEPDVILDNSIYEHQAMIRQMQGVPGVKGDKYEEAMNVKHCALSLVGEPIMYPKINEFIRLLHNKRISTFMVTNAQFPEQLIGLERVTQLYLSIDAASKNELKRIGRPLYPDFWERFLKSIAILKTKGSGEPKKPLENDLIRDSGNSSTDESAKTIKNLQRTVFRMTLIKEYNMNPKGYRDLILMGMPDFIEIKGATFCNGELSMDKIPYYSDVCLFAEQLVADLDQYEIACGHEHSCSVLVANKIFKIDGEWYTWIDFDAFFEGRDFYSRKTPEWALYNAKEKGFDPSERRWFRNKKVNKSK